MNIFETVDTTGHEQVLFCHDKSSSLKAIIALHDTTLGAAMGATRLFPYPSEADALRDVLRLSRGMTYKAACANIPVGGGKAVILAAPEAKNEEMLRAYGRFIEKLKGRFITGQDVNLTPDDVRTIRRETQHVVGALEKAGGPAPITARGVLFGIKAAVNFRWQQSNLQGMKVAVQGLGNVGSNLCKLLYEEGAELFVCDLRPENVQAARLFYGATAVEPEEIYSLDVDVFSPCAMGGILNHSTLERLRSPIVAGAANNQLEDEQLHGSILQQKDILYCPDYVINSGGLINVYYEMIGYNERRVSDRLENIYGTLTEIFIKAQERGISTHEAAGAIAEERIDKAKQVECLTQSV